MAFSGLHVVCGYAGGAGHRSSVQPLLSLPTWASWSEAPASITTNVAVPLNDTFGQPMFRIRSAVDAWVSVGKNPNASTGIRLSVQAGIDYDMFVDPGDRLAWVAA